MEMGAGELKHLHVDGGLWNVFVVVSEQTTTKTAVKILMINAVARDEDVGSRLEKKS